MPESTTLTIPERVRSVYQQVWHEYFDWEQGYCRRMLAGLDPGPSATGRALAQDSAVMDVEAPQNTASEAPSTVTDCIQLWHIDSDINVSATEVLSCPTYSCTSLEPVDPYEACTYSHKNLYVADDACEKLPFMPFSDDPRFPAAELFELYDSTGWESRRDPDYDLVVAEAARRLHFRFGISFADMDETEILPISIIERPERKGLLLMLTQRDMLPWPGSILSNLPLLPKTDRPPPTSLQKRVNGLRYLFCANLNCVEPYCPTHLNLDEQIKVSPIHNVNGDTEGANGPPCGKDCFKHLSYPEKALTYWDQETKEDFEFILGAAADLSSCNLAVMCDKRCSEIYSHRRRYATECPDPPGSSHASESANDSDSDADFLREKPIFADVVRGSSKAFDYLPPSEICQHLGKCDSFADCRCYRKQLHCHRNCRCDLTCQRRPKGCRCKSSGRKLCRTTKCPCFNRGRECDPELCRRCGANNNINKCGNTDLQHGKSKALEVKEGAYGLGLFLLEPAKAGDLIGEYVGEIINDKMTDARGVQTRHLGRNYLFALNAAWTIDAAVVGNETRFINHAQGSSANCRAEVREVNGDHRIGIYALKKNIEPREELFMDYGEEYFTGDKGGTPRASSKR